MGKKSKEKRERRFQAEALARQGFQPKPGLEKIYLTVIEWGVYLSLFSPLIVSGNFFFPYVTPKTIFFRIIVDIIFIAYILLVISNRKYLPKINILTISIIVFLLILIITSVTGVNFARSFWSVFERMTGLLTFFHLIIYFIVLTSVFRERKYWERFLTVSILFGVILCFYVFTSKEPTARGGGTIGNPDFLASYLLFDIFFAIILFLTKKGGWKVFYGLTLIPMLWLLFFPPQEPSRGGQGAFWGGIFLLFFGYLVFYLLRSEKKLLKILVPVLLVVLILTAAGLLQTGFAKEKIKGFEQSSSWQARKSTWYMGIIAWQKKPWLGWGLENFNTPFAKYFDPALPLSADIWYDRVHNIVLDTLVQAGAPGLLSYLAIFGIAVFSLLKVSLKVVEKRNLFLPLGTIALLATYFAQNIWVFDMISTYMMFFFSLAFIYFLTFTKKQNSQPLPIEKRNPFSTLLGCLLIMVTVFTLYFGNIQPARAAFYIVHGIASPLEPAINYFQKAITSSPMALYEAAEQFSRKMTDLVYSEKTDKLLLERGFELSIETMKKSITENPLDYRPILILGRQYNDFFLLKKNNPVLLSLAEQYLTKSIEMSPRNQQGYWALAQTRLSQGRPAESIELMQKAADLEPRYGLAQWYLAMTYKIVGDYKSAFNKVKEAEKADLDWKLDLSKLKEVIEICQNLDDDKCLVELYSRAIKLDPKDARFFAALAVAYANLKQYDEARQYAQEALSLNPDFASELEAFLKQLPQ
jgi:O-antigen ligase